MSTSTTKDATSMLATIDTYLKATVESAKKLDTTDFAGLHDHYARAMAAEELSYRIRGDLMNARLMPWYAGAAQLTDELRLTVVARACAEAHRSLTDNDLRAYAGAACSGIHRALDAL